ncbi:MAG: DedA family protein [Chloroflexota bacterium]|nr:DedA family protein [Chloroflexota bacterium]
MSKILGILFLSKVFKRALNRMLSLENTIIDWVISSYETLGYLGIVIFMVIEPTVLPFPGEIILTLAGWVLVNSTIDMILLSFLATFGTLIGCLIEYYITKTFGISLIKKYGKYFFITEKEIEKTEIYFIKYGYYFVFFTRFIPLFPKSLTSIISGVYKMNVFKFSIITFLASLPSNYLYLYLGNRLGEKYMEISEYIDPIKTPILVIILLLALFYFVSKFYKMKKRI